MSTLIDQNSILSSVSVCGLYGEIDITIPFPSPVRILLAENGSGKTTILNILYGALSGNLTKLTSINFREVIITFASGEEVVLKREDLVISIEYIERSPYYQLLRRALDPDDIVKLVAAIDTASIEALRSHPALLRLQSKAGLQPGAALDVLFRLKNERLAKAKNRKAHEFQQAVQRNIPYRVLYFPTYRRVEEDLESFGFKESAQQSTPSLIQFGMGDVKRQIDVLIEEIKRTSLESFSRISGQLLTQLTQDFTLDINAAVRLSDVETLKITLDRIGPSISDEVKGRIVGMMANHLVNVPRYGTLYYFLSKLVEAYDSQRAKDDQLKAFRDVCNSYLVDKEIVYDQSKVDLYVARKRSGARVDLGKLSSGEKQIISLFSRLYLELESEYIMLFDEPELSLSLDWQRKLLPDIIESNRCRFLLATTHSPFVFDNKLDRYASSLDQFSKVV